MKTIIALMLALCAACAAQDATGAQRIRLWNGRDFFIQPDGITANVCPDETRWDTHDEDKTLAKALDEDGGITVYQLFFKHRLVATINNFKSDGLFRLFTKDGMSGAVVETFNDLDAAKHEAEKLFAAEHEDQATTPTISHPGELRGSRISITGPFEHGLVIGAEPGGDWSCAYWDKQGGWGCNEKTPLSAFPCLNGCLTTMPMTGSIDPNVEKLLPARIQ